MACSYFSRQREAPYPHRKATDSEPGRQCWLIIKIDLKGRRRKKSSAELWVCWCEYLLAGLFHLTDGAVQKVCILNVLRDAGIWKATFQWKNKRTVPESKSHWAYFLFPLVVVFFFRCCWCSMLLRLAMKQQSEVPCFVIQLALLIFQPGTQVFCFWFTLNTFTGPYLLTHKLQTDVNTWIFKADSVKAQSRPYGLNSSVTIPWHCLVCRSLCNSILMTLFSCAVPSLSTDYISEAK